MLRNISISVRIVALMLILVLAIAALIGTVFVVARNVQETGFAETQTVMMDGERAKLKLGTQTMAVALGKALEGVTDRQAQHDIIKNYIQDYRFEDDKSGYYFTYVGTVIFMHPTLPKREGEDLGGTPDANGVFYVKELYENAKKGGGFVSFAFPKPPSMEIAPKLAYSEYIPGTDIWISTGIYVDNVAATIAGVRAEETKALRRLMALIIGGVGAVLLLVLLPLCVLILRSMLKPLGETVKAAEQLAHGDLNAALVPQGKDEITRLQTAFVEMAGSLKDSFATVRTKESEAVAKAGEAERASRAVLDVANRVGQTAHNVEEGIASISKSSAGVKEGGINQTEKLRGVLTSMENLSDGVQQIAASAETAARQSQVSNEKVEASVAMVRESGKAVEDLRAIAGTLSGNVNQLGQQSESIGSIMKTISDIAAQINLLAMNASIEAAHAGEAGKGFAVVAGEVRALAEKTKNAATEVAGSIKTMQELANLSVQSTESAGASIARVAELSEQTVGSLTEAQGTVKEAMLQVQSIAGEVDRQSDSSRQIAALVNEVSGIAGHNETLVNQVDEALHDLVGKSTELLALVTELQGQKAAEYVWDTSFSTGVDLVDSQHQRLFDIINQILHTLAGGKDAARVRQVLGELNDYTIKHFS